jgi:hypothetical protein
MSIAQSSGMLFHYQFVPISDNFYDSGEYRKSIENSLKNENQTSHDSYRIAQCYAQLEMPDSAYFYLNKFIDENKVDCRVVLIDDDFELLRENNIEWAKIIEKIESKYLESLAESVNREYALELYRLGTEYMRSSFTDFSYKRTEESSPRQIWKVQTKVRKDFDKLVRKYGFPTQSLVGSDAVYTSIVVILSPDI